MRGAKRPRLPKIYHAYPTVIKIGTVILHLKPKKDSKKYKSRDTHPEFCWHQHFSKEIRNFCYITKYRYRLRFNKKFLILLTLFESLKRCFNKHGCNFDDFSKIGLIRHNFCSWHHQQNFIKWFKLYSRCGHMTKVW